VALLFTAYVGVVLLLAAGSLRLLLAIVPDGPRANRLARAWTRALIRASGCRVRLTGAIPSSGGAVVCVSNHESYIDSLILLATLPADFRFVANHGVLDIPVIGTVLRKAGHLTVDRGSKDAQLACGEAMTAALSDGVSLIVYPEGTRAGSGGMLPFRLGAFRAAVEAGRPIVPVTLLGTRRVLAPDEWLVRRGPIDVVVHEPIAPASSDRAEMSRLRSLARARIASALDGGPSSEVPREADDREGGRRLDERYDHADVR